VQRDRLETFVCTDCHFRNVRVYYAQPFQINTETTMNKLLQEIRRIDTPTLSNAIERLHVRPHSCGFCDRTMRQLFPEIGVLCGFAVTAQAVTLPPGENDVEEGIRGFIEICEALRQSALPGIVVIQEIGPHPEYAAHCGEVMATMFQRFGAAGLVSDSAVRDMAEVQGLEFQMFAPGTVASHGNFRLVRTQVPVYVCGLDIVPGDLLHGDMNGLLKVPEEGRERLPALARQVVEDEKVVLDYLRGDGEVTPEELYRKFTH
jgi:regulator of RNase E activity RraA